MRIPESARKFVFFGSLLTLLASVALHPGFATDATPVTVPEPSALLLFGAAGVAGVVASLIQRRKK